MLQSFSLASDLKIVRGEVFTGSFLYFVKSASCSYIVSAYVNVTISD